MSRKYCVLFALMGALMLSLCPVFCHADDGIATLTDLTGVRSVVRSALYPYAPFNGSGYIFGTDNTLGTVYVYIPYDTLGKWGVSDSGYVGNITSNTISGVLYTSNGTQYDFQAPSMSLPRYRLHGSTGYTWTDAYIVPDSDNIQLRTDFEKNGSITQMYPYLIIGLMGVIVFCTMRFKR